MSAFDDLAEQVGAKPFDPTMDERVLWEQDVKRKAAQGGMRNLSGVPMPAPAPGPETADNPATRPPWQALARVPDVRKPGLSPAHAKAKDLLAGIKSTRNYPGLTEADINDVGNHDGETPAPTMGTVAVGPQQDAQPSAGPLRAAVAQASMGASPQRPTGQPEAPDALSAAQDAARQSGSRAGLVDQLNSATDSITGSTHFAADHAGDAIRKRGAQGVADVLQREDQGFKREDQSFQRSDESRKAGADQRQQTAFGDSQALGDPNSRQSRSARAQAVALYPKETGKIPPADFQQMSANDLKTLMGELPAKQVGTGGGAGAARGQAQLSKLLPPETTNVYASVQRIKSLVNDSGGWDKVEGVGLLGGFTPGFMMSEKGSALRSEVGNLAGIYLQSKGGKAITSGEEKIILGKIAANPKGATPQQLQQAMTIIERNVAGNARQSLGAVPRAQADQILTESGVPPEWARQSGTSPTRDTAQPPPAAGGKVKVSNGKETLMIDPADLPHAQHDGFNQVQ